MKIAFLHYHLKTGGVTTVIQQQAEAIANCCEILILTGEPVEQSLPFETIFIPGIGYDYPDNSMQNPNEVASSIDDAIKAKWKQGCDILHVHNPTLKKNKNFLKILTLLQKKNIRLFLQIHDFAEDGRPRSYFFEEYIPNAHYGVINSRDYNILLRSGLKPEGLHKIANTVKAFHLGHQLSAPKSNLVLYPVRALRRKNIGEAILLSHYFKNSEKLAITLPPNSPQDMKSYQDWKHFTDKKRLLVEFDSGLYNDFKALVISSKFHITTSITEGFGFSFLEPWAAGKFLFGRKLPEICSDFEKKGIHMDHLYPGLFIPVSWLDQKTLYEKWQTCIRKNYGFFGRPINEKLLVEKFNLLIKDHTIDFGILDEPFQKQVITHILADKKKSDELIQLNPFLENPGYTSNQKEIVNQNKKIVSREYTMDIYRDNLLEIYARTMQRMVQHKINKDVLLSRFLDPLQFTLLKWGEYDQ